jgi:hypothetical protein
VINKQGDAIDLTGLFQPGFLRFICFIKHLIFRKAGKNGHRDEPGIGLPQHVF